MKSYLILLPIFLLALFQGAFLPWNLVLLVILFWAAIRPAKESLLVAFFGGIFLDLAKGTSLGLSSLLLLVACYLLLLYRRKLDPLASVFLPVFVFLGSGFSSWLVNRFNWREALVLAILAFLGCWVFKNFYSMTSQGEIRLKT